MADVVAARIVIPVKTNADKATRKMDGLDKSIKKTGQSTKKTSSSFGFLKTALPLAALAALTFTLKKIISVTKEQQAAEAQLNAVLKSTKGIAGLTSKELKNMATSLQGVTTFGDEAIIKAQSLLLTFTKIGKDVFPQATETVLNMSKAMGTDLKSSAIQVGKALNDPVLGVTALRRVGVQLTASQEALIKSFVETGQVAKAQAIILGELETQFGGVARAAVDTLGGALDQLGNTFGDLFEISKESEFSKALIGNIQAVNAALKSSFSVFEGFGEILGSVISVLFEIGGIVLRFIKIALGPLLSNSQKGIGIFKLLAGAVEGVGKVLLFLEPLFTGLATVLGALLNIVVKVISGTIKGVVLLAVKFRELASVLGEAGIISNETAQKMRGMSNSIAEALGFTIQYKNGQLVAVQTQKSLTKELQNTVGAMKTYSKGSKEASNAALEIMASAGDVTAQLTLLNQKYAEQVAVVQQAGLDVAVLDKFYQAQRQSQLNAFLSKSIADESMSYIERKAALDAAYLSIIESDKINNEARLEAQREYVEQSKVLEQSRFAAINETAQQIGGVLQQGVDFASKVSALQGALGEREIERMKSRGATEEEIAKKRRKLQREQAKQAKAFGIVNAIINTALGVTQALTLPPPLSFIVAALTAAVGAVEIATIAATPIPSAQFGMEGFVPPGATADSGLVKVNQGEDINVTPTRFSGNNSGGGMPDKITLMVPGDQFDAYIVNSMNRNLNNGKVQIRRKGVVKAS